ncbi:MAG: PAS domain S-box protein [Candidatus Lokiarchaeota archaeon]
MKREFKNLFENSLDMICVHDLKGNFLIANKITLKKLGYSYEELLNLNINQIYSPKYGTLIKSEMNKLIHEEKLTFESEYLTKTGKTIPVEVISKHIIYDNKNLVLNVARDISERIKAKNKLLRFEQKYKKIPKEMELILIIINNMLGNNFYRYSFTRFS